MTVYDELMVLLERAQADHQIALDAADADKATITALGAEITSLKAALAECEGGEEPPVPPTTYDATIKQGDDLNAALAAAGTNARVKITGEFRSTLKPKSGQRLFGPFKLVGGSGDACNLKTANARNVHITDFEMTGWGGRGIVPWFGSRIRQFSIHDCGGNAMTGSYDNVANIDVAIEDGEVYAVGDPADASGPGVSAGGFKFTRTGPPNAPVGSSITMRRVDIHDVVGNGLWFDISAAGERLEDIDIRRASQNGFRYEISMGPVEIDRMTCRDNKQHGFFITSSAYLTARNVVVGGNASRGILLLEEERAILPTDVPMRPMDTHEGFKFRDIRVLDYVLNGDELQSKPSPAVTLRAKA